jgi:transcriptional regulator with XRE-family HTH domain
VWYARKQLSGFDSPRLVNRTVSQQKLAKALGVARVTVARWEGSSTTPGPETLWRIHAIVSQHFAKLFLREPMWMMKPAKPRSTGSKALSRISDADQQWLKQRAPLFAWAMLFGRAALMRREEWLAMLQISPRVLDGVLATPVDREGDFLSGQDVGMALFAVRFGASYGQLSTSVDERYPERHHNAGGSALNAALSSMFSETMAGVRYTIRGA